jgi:hypothetical protein
MGMERDGIILAGEELREKPVPLPFSSKINSMWSSIGMTVTGDTDVVAR